MAVASKHVSFEIPGRPVAKQRARARNGKFYTPAPTRRFEELVAWHARTVGVRDLSGNLYVEIGIYTHRPLRGDVDNYAKSILDGMVKGGLISDDREINCLSVQKGKALSREQDRTLVTVEWHERSEAHQTAQGS